jgi:hypothetical protein
MGSALAASVSSVLAIGWEPEIRGLLTVIIAVAVLCGSVYLILATNIGARLGFLVALTGLAGWMLLMGAIWMIYGIGLQGPMPSWEAVPGRTVLQDVGALTQAGIFDSRLEVPEDASYPEQADLVAERLVEEGWITLDEADPAFGQAGSEAGVLLEETGAFAAGEFQVVNVFDIGGDRYPMIGNFDLLAFWHEPRYALVEVAAVEQTRDEAGRAAPASEIDESQQRQYVYMIRDLGARRQPAFVLMIGSTIIFLTLCWLLHQRDARVRHNISQPAPAPSAGS